VSNFEQIGSMLIRRPLMIGIDAGALVLDVASQADRVKMSHCKLHR
jgi:hypothetical protein